MQGSAIRCREIQFTLISRKHYTTKKLLRAAGERKKERGWRGKEAWRGRERERHRGSQGGREAEIASLLCQMSYCHLQEKLKKGKNFSQL